VAVRECASSRRGGVSLKIGDMYSFTARNESERVSSSRVDAEAERIPLCMRSMNNLVTLGLGCEPASAAESRVKSIGARETLPCKMRIKGRQSLARTLLKNDEVPKEKVPSTVKCATGGNAAGAGVRARLAHARTQRPPPAGPKLRQKVRSPPRQKNSSSSSTAGCPEGQPPLPSTGAAR
jgi:hypothetical protein